MLSYLKGWRTVGINVVIVIAGVIAYLDAAGLGSILPPKYAWVPIGIGVANIVLRKFTTGPMGTKQ